jgi:CubicO group peptidase (beta-lactamase class C family)
VVVCVLVAVAAGNAGAESSSGASNPGTTWETVKPAAVGLDAKKLQEIASLAEAGKSNCLVVVRHGKLAGEWYFRGTDQNTTQEVASETKSFASTLVGIAQDHGNLRIGKSASTWIPQWKGTPAEAVTVRDLLSNDSGRQWSLALDGSMISSRDWTSFGVGLQQSHAPGTIWEYANTAIQTLQRVLQNATGQEVTAFAQQRLFKPLGMTHTKMSTDSSGNAEMFLGVQSTCRDLARYGELMLNRGQWNGKQIVSRKWVDEATGRPSTKLNAAYGYLWWLNRPGTIVRPLSQWVYAPGITKGPLFPSAPASMYWALGAGNQVIQVDPGSDTVVVRLGTLELQPTPPTFGQKEASTVVTKAVIHK